MLLPLVNVPMLDYTLEWLASAGVEEAGLICFGTQPPPAAAHALAADARSPASLLQVFVFCCAHAAQIEAYLESSKWTCVPSFAVHTIVSTDCLSVGEARGGAVLPPPPLSAPRGALLAACGAPSARPPARVGPTPPPRPPGFAAGGSAQRGAVRLCAYQRRHGARPPRRREPRRQGAPFGHGAQAGLPP